MLHKFLLSLPAVEPLAIFSLAYAAYLMAELFHFSGIIRSAFFSSALLLCNSSIHIYITHCLTWNAQEHTYMHTHIQLLLLLLLLLHNAHIECCTCVHTYACTRMHVCVQTQCTYRLLYMLAYAAHTQGT